MTHLDDKMHKAQMDDMRSFDEPMPSVGIFWYDLEDHTLFGVRKKELTPREVEERGDQRDRNFYTQRAKNRQMLKILTVGVYDMLHIGHILLFKHIKEIFPAQECRSRKDEML